MPVHSTCRTASPRMTARASVVSALSRLTAWPRATLSRSPLTSRSTLLAPIRSRRRPISNKQVDESNEDDNDATLKVTAINLPNLSWPENRFDVSLAGAAPGIYSMNFKVLNDGKADTTVAFKIGLTWSSGASTGTLQSIECCAPAAGTDPNVPAGAFSDSFSVGGYTFPAPGMYTVTATLDADKVIAESNEDDNVTTFDLTVPAN